MVNIVLDFSRKKIEFGKFEFDKIQHKNTARYAVTVNLLAFKMNTNIKLISEKSGKIEGKNCFIHKATYQNNLPLRRLTQVAFERLKHARYVGVLLYDLFVITQQIKLKSLWFSVQVIKFTVLFFYLNPVTGLFLYVSFAAQFERMNL